MKMVAFRIPKQIILPGIVVQIHRTVPGTKDKDGTVLFSKQADWNYEPSEGVWVIRLATDLGIRAARYALLHELQHVMTDYLHVAIKYHKRLVKIS